MAAHLPEDGRLERAQRHAVDDCRHHQLVPAAGLRLHHLQPRHVLLLRSGHGHGARPQPVQARCLRNLELHAERCGPHVGGIPAPVRPGLPQARRVDCAPGGGEHRPLPLLLPPALRARGHRYSLLRGKTRQGTRLQPGPRPLATTPSATATPDGAARSA